MKGTDALGSIERRDDHIDVRFVRHYPRPVETVWSALTEPARLADWMGAASVEPRAGGRFQLMLDGPHPMTGRVVVWDPPHVLEHEWRQRIVDDGVVRYELAEDGAGTLLTFTHRGLSVRNAKGFIPGTHAFLDRLEAHLAGASLPNWSERYAEAAPAYPSWS